MKLNAILHRAAYAALLTVCAAGQDVRQNLAKFVETPAVPGYEQMLAKSW